MEAPPISVFPRVRKKATRLAYELGFGSTPNKAIDKLLADHGIDLVWYPSVWDCLTLDVPYLTTVWDLQHRLQPFFPEVSKGREWDNRERMLAAVLRRASLVVTGTNAGRDEIEKFYGVPRERIILLPHPTPQFVTSGENAAPGLTGIKGEFLLYPAQFWPHKNHYALIEAMRLLRRRDGLDLSLILTGSDKGNLAYVRDLIIRADVSDAVHILGFVPEEQLAWLYRHALALTYVTYFGPENLPPLEAFAAGCPVIASDVSGAREQLGDAALLVDPRRPEQIADAVKSVRSDPELRRGLIERGASRAKRFSPDDFVSGIMNAFDEFEPLRKCWQIGSRSPGSQP
jgi:glycosyltransferase involved in cell wall biosynthesis